MHPPPFFHASPPKQTEDSSAIFSLLDDQTLTAFVGGTPALVTLLGISAAVLLITILALRKTAKT